MLADGKEGMLAQIKEKQIGKSDGKYPVYMRVEIPSSSAKPLSILYFRSNSKGRQLCLNKYWLNHYFPIAWGCEHGPVQHSPGSATVYLDSCVVSYRWWKKGRSKREIEEIRPGPCVASARSTSLWFIFFVWFARPERRQSRINGWWNWNFITAPLLIQCAICEFASANKWETTRRAKKNETNRKTENTSNRCRHPNSE